MAQGQGREAETEGVSPHHECVGWHAKIGASLRTKDPVGLRRVRAWSSTGNDEG